MHDSRDGIDRRSSQSRSLLARACGGRARARLRLQRAGHGTTSRRSSPTRPALLRRRPASRPLRGRHGRRGRPERPAADAATTGTRSASSTASRSTTIARSRSTARVLDAGQERFNIYCSPCHGRTGDGQGMIVQRGFSPPPSFHEPAARCDAPAGHFFDVITNGYGAMYSYASRVPPDDRWAIVAYIRALQLSQQRPARRRPGRKERRAGARRRGERLHEHDRRARWLSPRRLDRGPARRRSSPASPAWRSASAAAPDLARAVLPGLPGRPISSGSGSRSGAWRS